MIKSFLALSASLILLMILMIPSVTQAQKVAPFLPVGSFSSANQPAQSGGDYALHVRESGLGDGVLVPVFEALDARFMAANKEFTIEYWFKFSPGYDSNGKELFDHHQPSQEGFWIAFQNNHLWAGIDTQPGNDSTAIHLNPFDLSSNFNDGQWHHYAFVRDLNASPDRLCLYLDGTGSCYLDGSNSQWAAVAADIRPPTNRDGDDTNNVPLYAIGARVTGSGQIEATIDEIRISDVARYRQNFAPAQFPFTVDASTVMLFHFNEGNGNTTSGLSSTGNLTLEGALVKSFDYYSAQPLDPHNPTDAAWLNGMWVDGRFGVTSGPPPSPLNLTSPNGGELWLTGREYLVTWQIAATASIANVKLSYSTDGFSSIHPIVTVVSNTGVYSWTTPITPSPAIRVRVTDVMSSSIYDDSDTDFTLVEATYPAYPAYLPMILKAES